MAARIRKIRHDDETRAKIQTSQLVNRLTDHVFGKVELSPTQVRGIEVLLRKTLPDLSAMEHSGSIESTPERLTDDELARIAAAGRTGTAPKAPGSSKPH